MMSSLKEIDAEEATVLDALGVEVLYVIGEPVPANYPVGPWKNDVWTPVHAQRKYGDYTFYVRN